MAHTCLPLKRSSNFRTSNTDPLCRPWAPLQRLSAVPALSYFTPGFFLIALRLAPRPPPYGTPRLQDTWQSLVLLATYAAINAATVWLFVKRPFTFGDGTVGRFMW